MSLKLIYIAKSLQTLQNNIITQHKAESIKEDCPRKLRNRPHWHPLWQWIDSFAMFTCYGQPR